MFQAQLARRFNEGSNPNAQPMHPRSLALLRRFYAPYTAALESLLGRTFGEWGRA
jgi:N-formylglutamate amidohydrolase